MTPNEVLIAGEEYLVPSNAIVPMTGERHVQYFCAADISSNNGGELKPPPPPPQQQQQQQRVILVYSQQHEEPQQQPRFVMMKVTALNKNTKSSTSVRRRPTNGFQVPKTREPQRKRDHADTEILAASISCTECAFFIMMMTTKTTSIC